MTIVGADHHTALPRVTEQIGDIVANLAGHVDAVFLHQVFGQSTAHSVHTPPQFVDHPGNPRRRGFNKAKAELWKRFWQTGIDQTKKRADVEDSVLVEELA